MVRFQEAFKRNISNITESSPKIISGPQEPLFASPQIMTRGKLTPYMCVITDISPVMSSTTTHTGSSGVRCSVPRRMGGFVLLEDSLALLRRHQKSANVTRPNNLRRGVSATNKEAKLAALSSPSLRSRFLSQEEIIGAASRPMGSSSSKFSHKHTSGRSGALPLGPAEKQHR